MASVRKTMHSAIVTRLGGITVAGGYHNTVAKVTKRLLTQEQVRDFPTVMVLAGPVGYEPSDASMVQLKATATYMIVGVGRAAEDSDLAGLLDDAATDLLEDIEECLLTAQGVLWDAPGVEMKMLQLQSEPAFLDYANNYAEVQVLIAVTYYVDANT